MTGVLVLWLFSCPVAPPPPPLTYAYHIFLQAGSLQF
jgi:hypothetical protein